MHTGCLAVSLFDPGKTPYQHFFFYIDDIKSADVPLFTIHVEGAKDKRGNENSAIGIRYVKNGEICESALCVKVTGELYAQSLVALTLKIFKRKVG